MIKFRHRGDLSKTSKYLKRVSKVDFMSVLERYAREGVVALASATPLESGRTAMSWSYEISSGDGSAKITFLNSNIQNGVPIAIIIQYGHGTGTGGWVEGRDYINPAVQPIFDKIANDAWREVTKP